MLGIRKIGLARFRRKGSHVMLSKAGEMATLAIPGHAVVARGTLRALIARAGMSVEEFLGALEGRLAARG